MKPNQTRNVSSKELRRILHDFADDVCDEQEKIQVTLKDNSFVFHLEGATINISLTTCDAKRGGTI